jgi:hypothetical protein
MEGPAAVDYTPGMLDRDGVAFNREQSYESSGFGKLAARTLWSL